jgi:AraC-like DNA-binding protein
LAAFEFVARRPGAPLEPFVESVWFARSRIAHRWERIAPTGSTVAVLVLGAPIVQIPRDGSGTPYVAADGWLAGPHDGPVINAPAAETVAVGIVSSTVGCEPLFGVLPAPLRGRVVDLATTWPAGSSLRLVLRRILLTGREPLACLAATEATLLAGLRSDVPGWQRCAAAVRALEADPVRRIAGIADELGITHAHLDREFVRVVGLTPRALARLLRLRRVLDRIDIHSTVSWTDLAAAWGWFDHSHFVRDFKRHTGVTPSAYLTAQRAAHDAGQQAPGFIPHL